MSISIKKAMLLLASGLTITNFSVEASETYVLQGVPNDDQIKNDVFTFLSKNTFPSILNPNNQKDFINTYKDRTIQDTYRTKEAERQFIKNEISKIVPSATVIPITKSLYELIAYTFFVEKKKLDILDGTVVYKGASKTVSIMKLFNPELAFTAETPKEKKTITGGCANLMGSLKNTFWLVNDYALEYVNKEDSLKSLLNKFKHRSIDQLIHEVQGAHSLLIAGLQQDEGYAYGASSELTKDSSEYQTALDKLDNEASTPEARQEMRKLLDEKFNEYNKKHKAKNVHYANQQQLLQATEALYNFIQNMIDYEKKSDKYILYRGGDSLDWKTHTYRLISYSDGLFAGMLDDGGCAIDIAWRNRITKADGNSYMQRLELERSDLLNKDIAVFIPPVLPLVATVGMGETHHPRSKIIVVFYTMTNKGFSVNHLAMGTAESIYEFTQNNTPEYYMDKVIISLRDESDIDKIIQKSLPQYKYEISKIQYLCENTKFINEDGTSKM